MRAPRLAYVAACALALSALRPLPALFAAPPRAPIVVIVAASSSVRDVSNALLRRIFLGEPTVFAGQRMIPVNHPPGDPLRTAFDEGALGMSPDAAGRYWVDRRIRGQGFPPRAVAGAALIREIVAKLPGGIGYVGADQLAPNVRAVSVDGVGPQHPDYSLAPE